MKKKNAILGIAVLALLVIGSGALFVMGGKPPSIGAVRDNPALFKPEEYKDRVALHTRLSSLFPRGTARDTVDAFMQAAGFESVQSEGLRCTYSTDFGIMRFIYTLNDDRLVSVHILDGGLTWPEFRESCPAAAQELTPVAPVNEKPIILPLESLDIEE